MNIIILCDTNLRFIHRFHEFLSKHNNLLQCTKTNIKSFEM